MAEVYRALDRLTGEPTALKVLRAEDGERIARFVREARVLGELRHPGIVRYVAHGQTPNGYLYLAMEWLEGETLADRLRQGGVTLRETLTLCGRVADALGVAHARGVVHRDVKPANLFLPDRSLERVKVLDFGIARLVRAAVDLTQTGLN